MDQGNASTVWTRRITQKGDWHWFFFFLNDNAKELLWASEVAFGRPCSKRERRVCLLHYCLTEKCHHKWLQQSIRTQGDFAKNLSKKTMWVLHCDCPFICPSSPKQNTLISHFNHMKYSYLPGNGLLSWTRSFAQSAPSTWKLDFKHASHILTFEPLYWLFSLPAMFFAHVLRLTSLSLLQSSFLVVTANALHPRTAGMPFAVYWVGFVACCSEGERPRWGSVGFSVCGCQKGPTGFGLALV